MPKTKPTNHINHLKAVPASPEAERAVLGSILIDPDAIVRVAQILSPGEFFRESHNWIYAAMTDLARANSPIDFVTLTDLLEQRDQLDELGGPAYIIDLINGTPTSINADHYARIVHDKWAARRVIQLGGELAEYGYNPPDGDDAATILATAAGKAQALLTEAPTQATTHIYHIMQAEVERLNYLRANNIRATGLPTGFTLLDRLTGGLEPGSLNLLAARPSMGKTSLAVCMAVNAAKLTNASTLIFSLEMSNELLGRRILSMETSIDAHRLRTGEVQDEEWPVVLHSANQIAHYDITIADNSTVSMDAIRAVSLAHKAKHGKLDFIVIDYIGLMKIADDDDSENRNQAIGVITRDLKELAGRLKVPILVLSQLSRRLEQRADKHPILSDLRDSGNLEQDADVIMFIYRDDYYNEDSAEQNIAQVIVAKDRNGATGTVSLFFRPELTQFRNLEIQRTELAY